MNKLSFSIIVITCLMLSSASLYSQHYYAPEDGYLLAFNEKDDFKCSLSANLTGLGDGWTSSYNLQAGHSPREHLSVVGNFFELTQNPEKRDDNQEAFNTHFGSVAVGTYFFLKRSKNALGDEIDKKNDRMLLFDFYTGYGLGNSYREYDTGGHSRFHFQKLFVQGGIHLNEKRIGFSTVFRYNLIDFNRGKVTGKFDGVDRSTLEHLQEKNPHHQLEVSLRFSTKIGERFRFFYSNATALNADFLTKSSTNHIGFMVEIDQFSKSSKKKKRRR